MSINLLRRLRAVGPPLVNNHLLQAASEIVEAQLEALRSPHIDPATVANLAVAEAFKAGWEAGWDRGVDDSIMVAQGVPKRRTAPQPSRLMRRTQEPGVRRITEGQASYLLPGSQSKGLIADALDLGTLPPALRVLVTGQYVDEQKVRRLTKWQANIAIKALIGEDKLTPKEEGILEEIEEEIGRLP